jgi:two-component system sensor histidine kinase SenX3
MDPTAEGALLTLLGVLIGALTVLAWRVSEHQLRGPVETELSPPAVPAGVGTVLSVLRSSALVLDEDDRVLQASAPAYALGIVRDGELRVPELLALVQQVRRDGETRQTDLDIPRGLGKAPTFVAARVAALSSRTVLVLVDDRTRERRVEAIRRDFVANVSHELKTPVGALTLLAEAVQEAADDPEAVARFAGRMRTEAARLNRLVQQIIELSRLQGDVALDRPAAVDVDRVVGRVLDAIEVEAKAKDVEVLFDGRHGLQVLGDENQVALALGNLVSNAVAYSPADSRVVVTALTEGASVEITVADRGIGIPEEEIDRIFERFYRVDPARHRSTGGTGLGLSIVKHVAASHGGEVRVWSQPGHGSAFTLRLPRRIADDRPAGAGTRIPPTPGPEEETP